jgi:hypothetical protein
MFKLWARKTGKEGQGGARWAARSERGGRERLFAEKSPPSERSGHLEQEHRTLNIQRPTPKKERRFRIQCGHPQYLVVQEGQVV